MINVKDFGVKGDGKTNDGPAIYALFGPQQHETIVFPTGDYFVDNSAGYLTANEFCGSLIFERTARMIFKDPTQGGLTLAGGTGAYVEGFHGLYASPITARISASILFFQNTTDTQLVGTTIEDSPGAGTNFWAGCIRPSVTEHHNWHSWADGLTFVNCQDVLARSIRIDSSGDDSVSLLNYTSAVDLCGAVLSDLLLTGSQASLLSVIGQRNVVINGFKLCGSGTAGIRVTQDPVFNTRAPGNVVIRNGSVSGVGTLLGQLGAPLPNQYAVFTDGVCGAHIDLDCFGTVPPTGHGSLLSTDLVLNVRMHT